MLRAFRSRCSHATPACRRCAKPFVEPTANNPVMIDQRQRLIRDDRLELIFGGPGVRHIGGAGFGRNVVPPVPAQCVIIDRKFASSSLDRGTRCQKPLDPHTFRMITALASACGRPPSSRHYFPHDYKSKSNSTKRRMNRPKTVHI